MTGRAQGWCFAEEVGFSIPNPQGITKVEGPPELIEALIAFLTERENEPDLSVETFLERHPEHDRRKQQQ